MAVKLLKDGGFGVSGNLLLLVLYIFQDRVKIISINNDKQIKQISESEVLSKSNSHRL